MPVMMLIVYGTIIAVMWFGGKMVYAGTLEPGKLITFFTYITQIMMSLMMVSMVFMMLTRSVACARRIAEVVDDQPAIPAGRAAACPAGSPASAGETRPRRAPSGGAAARWRTTRWSICGTR